MKKFLMILSVFIFLFPGTLAEADEASAADRIAFYNQGITEELLTAFPYNSIVCKSASYSVLGGNGCSLFAGLHAYQWLFGSFQSLEELTFHAQQMVYLLRGKNPAVQSNGQYVAYQYAYENGARKSINIQNNVSSVMEFFDQKKGVLYLHATWPHGGHYLIAVGYTHRELDGKDVLLLHVVDSSKGELLSFFEGYNFVDFSRIELVDGKHTDYEFWMPLSETLNIAFGLWVPANNNTQ